jgi:hypothetical protein
MHSNVSYFLTASILASLVTVAAAQNAPPPPPSTRVNRAASSRPLKTPDPTAAIKRAQTDLKSSDRQTRLRAVDTLSRVGRENAAASFALIDALRDTDQGVRSRSLAALRIRSLQLLPIAVPLLALLKSEKATPEVQVFARETLNNQLASGGPASKAAAPLISAAGPRLLQLMSSRSASVRTAALRYADYRGAKREGYTEAVRARLQDTVPSIRFWAAILYCGLNPEDAIASEALSLVLAPLRSPDPNSRYSATGSIRDLLVTLNVPDGKQMSGIPLPPLTTSKAVISAINDKIVAELLPLTRDSQSNVRSSATLALSVMRGTARPEIIQAMTERLTDGDGNTRSIAARFFIEHQGDFSPAVPNLLRLVKLPVRSGSDNEPDVNLRDARNYSFIALGTIGKTEETARNGLLALLLQRVEDPDEQEGPFGAFEALAEASTDHPELVQRLLEYRDSAVVVKAALRQNWRSQKLASLMYAQRNRPETFAVLTKQFDREPAAIRQEALFDLVYRRNWTIDFEMSATPVPILIAIRNKSKLGYN